MLTGEWVNGWVFTKSYISLMGIRVIKSLHYFWPICIPLPSNKTDLLLHERRTDWLNCKFVPFAFIIMLKCFSFIQLVNRYCCSMVNPFSLLWSVWCLFFLVFCLIVTPFSWYVVWLLHIFLGMLSDCYTFFLVCCLIVTPFSWFAIWLIPLLVYYLIVTPFSWSGILLIPLFRKCSLLFYHSYNSY